MIGVVGEFFVEAGVGFADEFGAVGVFFGDEAEGFARGAQRGSGWRADARVEGRAAAMPAARRDSRAMQSSTTAARRVKRVAGSVGLENVVAGRLAARRRW